MTNCCLCRAPITLGTYCDPCAEEVHSPTPQKRPHRHMCAMCGDQLPDCKCAGGYPFYE